MALIINEGFDVNAPAPIDKRLLVDRVTGTTASLVSLTKGYNYRNMYVWVREEKAFYYLINSPTQGGATSSDWTKLSTGVGGSTSSIDLSEVAFGTGTGVTSSRNFTFATFSTTLIFGSGSTIASTSRLSSIIGGCNNTIGTASCNSGIFGGFCNTIGTASCNSAIIAGCNNTVGTSSRNSGIFGGCGNNIATSSYSSMIGGFSNTLSGCDRASIIGGFSNTLSQSGASSIVGGGSNILFNSCSSSIIGGGSNKLCDSYVSSIVGGGCNIIATASCNSSIIGGQKNTLSFYSRWSSIIGGCNNIISASSSSSSIVGGCNNTLCNNSCNSVIIGGAGLTLSNECSVVYVPKLKIATASVCNTADKVLVWDTDNLVKYRDVSTIGGGGGSINLELNAGLTNSGITYGTIYNTTVADSTLVPVSVPNDGVNSTGNVATSLTWLKGLTAGYFKEMTIVQVLDKILFPAVPHIYVAPTLKIEALTVPFGICEVNLTDYQSDLKLSYTQNEAGLPIQYTWYCSSVSNPPTTIIQTCVSGSANETKGDVSFAATTPIRYYVQGTVSHLAGALIPDSAGTDTPLPTCVQAGIKFSTNPSVCTLTIIFPYFFGRVPATCTTLTAANVVDCSTAGVGRVVACATDPITINFNVTSSSQKGYFAVPFNAGIQTSTVYNCFVETTNNQNYGTIPGAIWATPGVVPNVDINGVLHSYCVYLFCQGSETSGPWCLCSV